MKTQMMQDGLSRFNEHQKLEIATFFSVPQGDTNDIAHDILKVGNGCLNDAIDDKDGLLSKIKGVDRHTSAYLKALPGMSEHYSDTKLLTGSEYDTGHIDAICGYFREMAKVIRNDEVHAAALTSDLSFIREKKLADGSVHTGGFCPRMIVSFAFECRSDSLILVQFRNSANFCATCLDTEFTGALIGLLDKVDIRLVDHIIAGPGGCHSMRTSKESGKSWLR